MTTKRKIIIFGESHSQAPLTAQKKGFEVPDNVDLRIHRMTKIKNGQLIGSLAFADMLALCETLTDKDLLVSLIGGNQHSGLSLIQHPRAFDVVDGQGALPDTPEGTSPEIIPRNALKAIFERAFRTNDGQRILSLAQAGPHRTVHLMAPPPKDDDAHILRKVETDFAARGISEKGVSPAPMRRRIWEIQNEALGEVLAEGGVELLSPPKAAVKEDGFLKPDYFASDATHANTKYGNRLLEQVLKYLSTF